MVEERRTPGHEGRPIVMNAGNREYTNPFEVSADDAYLETVADFEGDDVSGGNIAYGNSPRTSGARFTPPYKQPEGKDTPYSEPGE